VSEVLVLSLASSFDTISAFSRLNPVLGRKVELHTITARRASFFVVMQLHEGVHFEPQLPGLLSSTLMYTLLMYRNQVRLT